MARAAAKRGVDVDPCDGPPSRPPRQSSRVGYLPRSPDTLDPTSTLPSVSDPTLPISCGTPLKQCRQGRVALGPEALPRDTCPPAQTFLPDILPLLALRFLGKRRLVPLRRRPLAATFLLISTFLRDPRVPATDPSS